MLGSTGLTGYFSMVAIDWVGARHELPGSRSCYGMIATNGSVPTGVPDMSTVDTASTNGVSEQYPDTRRIPVLHPGLRWAARAPCCRGESRHPGSSSSSPDW